MKKGQALVEFIIIMPVFIMLVLGIVDLGKIFYTKNVLESQITEVIQSYEEGSKVEDIKKKFDVDNLEVTNTNSELKISITKEIEIMTPGLNLILGSPYELVVTRELEE